MLGLKISQSSAAAYWAVLDTCHLEVNLIHLRVCHLAVWRYCQPLRTLQWYQKTVYLTPWESLIFCVETLPSSRNLKVLQNLCIWCVGVHSLALPNSRVYRIIEYVIRSWHLLASSTFFHWCLTRNCEYMIALVFTCLVSICQGPLEYPEIYEILIFFCGLKMV